MTEDMYIDYLAHMLDESCNEKAVSIKEADFELKPLGAKSPRSNSASQGAKPKKNGFSKDPAKIRAMSREEALKNKIDKDMWLAAQLPFPEEDKHGELGGCEIVQGTTNAPVKDYMSNDGYLKTYYVKGYYADGTSLQVGPISNRKIAIFYIQLHNISVKTKEWEKFKSQLDSFEKQLAKQIEIQSSSSDDRNDTVKGFKLAKFDDGFAVVDVVKFSDGYYLRMVNSNKKLGPFPSQNVAHKYALEHKYDAPGAAFGIEKKSDGKFHVIKLTWNRVTQEVIEKDSGFAYDSEDQARKEALGRGYVTDLKVKAAGTSKVAHIRYPIFIFEYTMAGIDCMDIVIAETKESAMKLFASQWKSFDGSKVIRASFSNEVDLEKELMMLRIKDINIFEIRKEQLDEYIDIANEIGNPLTNPKLKDRQRNKNCQYILGPKMKDGRVPVTIRQDFERRQKDNLAQKRVKPGAKY